MRHYLLLLLLLCPALQGIAQDCNGGNDFDVPNVIDMCSGQPESIDWFDWYTPNGNGPDLNTGVWISPSEDTTTLASSVAFPFSMTTETGTWSLLFTFSDPNNPEDDLDTCSFEIELESLNSPLADFGTVLDGICGSEGIEFDLNPAPGVSYSWNFGDGTSSTQTQPTHVYALDGGGSQNVSVTLTAEGANGCTTSTTELISVLQNPNPGIDDLAPLCLNNPSWPDYELFPSPQPASNPGIASWNIDWGNGSDTAFTSVSVFNPPGTQYSDYGYQTVTIDVTGNNGCTTQIVDSLFVGNNPQIGSANPGNTNGLCSPYLLEFPITNYTDNADGTVYNFDFGDGTSLTYDQDDLEPSPPTTVSHEYVLSSCGSTTPEGSQNAFRFRVEAVNECGTSVTTVDPIRIHLGPDPVLEGPNEVCMGQSFAYSIEGAGQIVTSSECNPTESYWEITPLNGQAPLSPSQGQGTSFNATFPEPGEYEISTLDVHPNCANGNDQMIVCVYPELQALGQVAPQNGCAPLTIDLQDLSNNPSICGDPNTTWIISGGPYNFLTGGPNDVAPTVELTAAGTYTITLKVAIPDKDACPPDEQTFTIEVTEPPTVEVGSLTMICAGDELEMMISSLDDGGSPLTNWSWQLNGAEFSTVQGTVPLTFSDPGEYVVTGEATNLCGSDTSNIYIDVDSIPEIDFELPDLPAYCAGDTLLVIATGAVDYTWSDSPVIVGDLHSHCVPIVPQTNVSLGLSANSANGCTNTASIEIDIAPLPEVSISVPAPPCPGETVTFSASSSGGSGAYAPLQWSGASGSASGAEYNWTAPPTAGNTAVEVTVIDDVGCENSSTASLTSFNNPLVEAGDSLFLCDNDAVTEPLTGYSPGLTAGGGAGTWSGSGLAGVDGFTPAGVGTYELTYNFTDVNGCNSSDIRIIDVETFVQVEAGSPMEACFGDEPLAATGWTPNSGLWSGTGISADGTLDPNLTPGTYVLTLENGNGSCFSQDNNTFTVHPLPEPVISVPLELCEGDVFQATLSEPNGAALTWDFNPAAPLTIDSLAGDVDLILAGLATSTDGCEKTTEATIAVNLLPAVTVPVQDVLCNQAIPTSLTGATPMGGVWSGPGITDPDGSFIPADAGTGISTVTYTYTDTFGCTNNATADVEVVEPQEAEAGPDLTVCDIDTTLVLDTFTPISGGTWTGSGIADPSGLLETGPLAPGDYTLTYIFGSGTCESIDTRVLSVLPRPSLDITASAPALCDGETVTFDATVSDGLPPYTFLWDPGVTVGMETSTTTSAAAVVDAADGPTLSATLTVMDANGCSETVSVTIVVWDLPIVDAGADVQFCDQPIAVDLSGFSPPNGTWSGIGITDSALGSFLPSDVGPGLHEVVYTYEDENGCLNSDTAQVEVIVPQVADAGPDLSICDIDTLLILDGFNPVTSSGWTGPGVTSPSGTVDAGPLLPGNYTLTYTIGTGTCESMDIRMLEVRPLPSVSLSADDFTVCDEGTVAFSGAISGASAPYNWTWNDNVGGASGMGNVTTASTSVDLGAGPTFTTDLVAIDATGCSQNANLTIDVLALPTVNGGGDTVFCNTDIPGVLLDFSPGLNELGTGTWMGLGAAATAVDASGQYTPNSSGVGSFDVVYTYTEMATGCTNLDTILVDITDPVDADAGPDEVVCDNAGLLQLSGFFPNTNVTWSGSGAGAAALINAATGLIDPALLAPGDYVYLLAFGNGTCYTEDEMEVHVDPLPAVSTSGNDLYCGNDGAVVLAPPSPLGGTWEGPGSDGTGGFQTDAPETGPGTYDLIYWYQDAATGCRDTADHVVTVQEIPSVNAGMDTTFCNQPIDGSLLNFSPGLTENGNGSWSGLGGFASAVSPDGTIQPNEAGAGSFIAVYTYTASATGCTNTADLNVTIAEPLVADAGPNLIACDNDSPLQIEGYFPTNDVDWTGTSSGAEAGLLDSDTGLLSPGLLPPGSYTYLLSYGVGTCYTEDELSLTIDPLPELTLDGPDAFCNNLGTVSLTNATPSGGTWFGNGVTNPSAGTFASGIATGEYAPAYWYEDPLTGCRDTVVHSVTIHPVPVAAFTTDTLGCSNLDLPLENLSSGSIGQDWDLGGVGTSIDFAPEFTFPGDGTFTLILEAYNEFGCLDTAIRNVVITHPPVANLVLTPDSGCAPLDVEFANLSDAPFGTFNWNVNGEVYVQEAPPALNFGQGDSIADYAVVLTATNLCGEDATEDAIVVYPTPVMAFAFEEDTVCSPFEMNLMNASVGLPNDVIWDFGDGSGYTGTNPPDHWYSVDTVAQIFEVTLIGTNQCGTDTASGNVLVLPNQVEAFFTLSTPSGCAPFTLGVEDFSSATTAVSYDFDNGDFAATPLATTTYANAGNYTVTQYVTNGCSYDTLALPVEVYPVPEVTLSVVDPNGCEGALFDFESTTDNPGEADWDFGDGSSGTGLNTSHTFTESGTYTVTFSTESPLTGCTTQQALEVEVFPNPVASVDIDDALGCAPLSVTLTNTSSGSQFQTWDYGDNSELGFQVAPEHIFINDGLDPVQYTVTLVVQSPQLCLDSLTTVVTALPTPVASFSLEEIESCTFPVDIVTENQSFGSINHLWTVNGLNPVASTQPTFNADAIGNYTVSLTAANGYGCEDTAEDNFTVHLAPTANLNANPRIGCNPLSVDFQDLSSYSQATSLFIDGIYDGPLPSDGLLIDQVGTFESHIVAISPEGCTDTLFLDEDFTVHPVPFADFAFDPLTSSPENTSFQFTNQSNTAFATNWTFGDGNGSFIPNPLHRYDEPGEYTVALSVQNEFGCSDLTADLLVIDDKITVFVPNAFTPASDGIGDGINDAFKPLIRGVNLIQKYTFQVFDRWGTVIFETNDYDEYWKGDVFRGPGDDFDYFAQNEVYNWKVTLILSGEEADEVIQTSNPFCNGPRQFCGHVTLLR